MHVFPCTEAEFLTVSAAVLSPPAHTLATNHTGSSASSLARGIIWMFWRIQQPGKYSPHTDWYLAVLSLDISGLQGLHVPPLHPSKMA